MPRLRHGLPQHRLLLRREQRKQIALFRRCGIVVFRQPLKQRAIAAALLAKELRMPIARLQLGLTGGEGKGIVKPAKLIDQPQLARRATIPDAALGDRIDLLGRLAACLGNQPDKALIAALDGRLQQRFDLWRKAAQQIRLARQRRGAHPVRGNAVISERPLKRIDHREDADRSSDRARLGKDFGAGCRDPIAAAGRDVGHGDDHRNALGLLPFYRQANALRGGNRAAR